MTTRECVHLVTGSYSVTKTAVTPLEGRGGKGRGGKGREMKERKGKEGKGKRSYINLFP